jgi:elongation factor 1-gamma
VGGFLQRIDYARKYAFGVMAILKNEKGEFPIRGVWIFRGQDIPPQMKDECYDLDLYTWTKADPADAAVKERVGLLLEEADKIDGLENVECKVFK